MMLASIRSSREKSLQSRINNSQFTIHNYEEQAILGCAVEGDSSSHHGGRHGAGNHKLYGIRTVLGQKKGKPAVVLRACFFIVFGIMGSVLEVNPKVWTD